MIKGSSKEFLLEQIINISNQSAEKILEIYHNQNDLLKVIQHGN